MKINKFIDKLTKRPGWFDFYFLFLQKVKKKSFKILFTISIFLAIFLGYVPKIIGGNTLPVNENNSLLFFMLLCLLFSLLCYVFVIFLINISSTETVEEKNSRAMEIIISSLPAKKHMFARIFSNFSVFFYLFIIFLLINFFSTLIFQQTGDGIFSFAKKLSGINKNSSIFDIYKTAKLHGDFILFLVSSSIIIFITIFTYLTFAVSLSSIPSSSQDSQYLMLPLIIIPIMSFTSFNSVYHSDSNTLKTILGCVPLINLCFFPTAFLSGSLLNSWLDPYLIFLLALLINLLFYYLVSFPLTLIYQQGILNYSQKAAWIQFKEVIKSLKYQNNKKNKK
ncbi:ABC transporter permease [symbiont of Argiope bruennichi]|uniref:ABC transporter permease n=1 Tax=symbiont of Argiope bruennichi TaxID=2810479 RepID=UPI003DA33B4A